MPSTILHRRAGAVLIAMVLVLSLLGISSPPVAQADEEDTPTVTGDFLPTWQTNGTVWSIAVANGVAWVGGSFTAVRPPGSAPGENEVERKFAAAFDAESGELLPWSPEISGPTRSTPEPSCPRVATSTYECGTVWEVKPAPDGQTVYLGGDFTQVDGSYASVAAFDTSTGAQDRSFRPGVWGRIYSLAVSSDTVYVGGSFDRVAPGTLRSNSAAFLRSDGSLTSFAPQVDNYVRAMSLSADSSVVVMGGAFNNLNGRSLRRLGAVNAADGTSSPWADNRISTSTVITDMVTHGDQVVVTGETSGTVNEGADAYDPMTGRRTWYDGCQGASHSLAVLRDVVYVGSHSHNCSPMVDGFSEQYNSQDPETRRRFKLRAQVPEGDTARLLEWSPQTDDGNGPRAMAASTDTLWVGGEFIRTNNIRQQGLTRFGFAEDGAPQSAPRQPQSMLLRSTAPGEVAVTITGVEDRDSHDLTYEIIRDGNVADPVHRVAIVSKPWAPPVYTWIDTDVVAGRTYSYDVRAVDDDGNVGQRSQAQSVQVAGTQTPVEELAPQEYATSSFTLDEEAFPVRDRISSSEAYVGSGVQLNEPGAEGFPGTAGRFSGSPGGAIVDRDREWGKKQVSVEAWFLTSSTRGGQIVGQATQTSATSLSNSNGNRSLYMLNDGRIAWGVKAGSRQAVVSSDSFNDGTWHHAVGILDPVQGISLYVDGSLVGSDASVTWADALNGFWRIGGDQLNSWPFRPESNFFDGLIDEVSIYPYPMPASQVLRHASMGLTAPTDQTSPSQVDELTASVEGSEVSLAWSAATDDTAVTLYRIYRGSSADFVVSPDALVGTTELTSYIDTIEGGSNYFYRVSAVDAVGNEGQPSAAREVTAPFAPDTVVAVADATADEASPGAVSGGSWVVRSRGGASQRVPYVAFDAPVAPAGAELQSATLRLQVADNSWSGTADQVEVRLVPDSSWVESTLSWSTRPAVSDVVLGVFPGGVTTDEEFEVSLDASQVASLLGGRVSIALVQSGGDAAEFLAREHPNGGPELDLLFAP